ncbi:hypothetical protein [Desulfovibrio ferrophilus]|uniref:Uncharacterized protein n=1 Tax=Desulfovibrio ferrophilus TaxID=241368 RepID=A0A2Z6AWV2_9BACT|nr:hypothetical protein [Desulfovibrio ferrophilus]BBD07729.1 uncharacterized protein DFE_1003 [Desulfovibrio ferrophilus]
MTILTRRQLFRGAVKAGQRIADTATGKETNSQTDQVDLSAELEAIAGDFPPEMLQMEAERLGLDPDSPDRTKLLTAVYEAMAAAGGPRAPGQ